MLTREQFTKDIRKLFVDENTNATKVGKIAGETQQNFSKKVRNGSFGYVDFVNVLNLLGYEVIWKKKEKE